MIHLDHEDYESIANILRYTKQDFFRGDGTLTGDAKDRMLEEVHQRLVNEFCILFSSDQRFDGHYFRQQSDPI